MKKKTKTKTHFKFKKIFKKKFVIVIDIIILEINGKNLIVI